MLPKKNVKDVDISNLAAKSYFIALKIEVYKLDINRLVHVPIGLNNLKPKVDDLDVINLKTVRIDVKKLKDVVNYKVVKFIVYNRLNTQVNNLENKTPHGPALFQTNQ